LFPPPTIQSGSDYKGFINAKRVRIEDDKKECSAQLHENNSMQKLFDEMATYYFDEMVEVNADNKALISFNEAAVNKRTQPNRLLLDSEVVHYPMHDFPQPEKCIPSSYMVLTPKNSGEAQYYDDDLGRKRIVKNTAGPSYFFLRSSHYYTVNIETHINDLSAVRNMYPAKGAMGVFVDCGTDWEFHLRSGKSSILNIYEYGRFWLENKLTVFFVAAYLPENHHQGPIEHSFGPRTNDIAGAIFLPFARLNEGIFRHNVSSFA
jgi:hypothetical protein